jgi:hypothetical protein
MKINRLSEEAIDFVIDHLSEVSRFEAEIFEQATFDLRKQFVEQIGKPFTGAFTDTDGVCFAVMFMEVLGDLKWRAHFIFTEEAFKENGIALTLFFERFSSRLVYDTKGEIEILSVPGLDDIFQWHLSLGFQYEGRVGAADKFIKRGN